MQIFEYQRLVGAGESQALQAQYRRMRGHAQTLCDIGAGRSGVDFHIGGMQRLSEFVFQQRKQILLSQILLGQTGADLASQPGRSHDFDLIAKSQYPPP